MKLNKTGLAAYPAEIKKLPFCNWRYEMRKGKATKVPYNPKTGVRASPTNPRTFADIATALNAVTRYDGIGLRLDGDIGCIDIDDCIQEGGTLTEFARSVLAMLPDCICISGFRKNLYLTVMCTISTTKGSVWSFTFPAISISSLL